MKLPVYLDNNATTPCDPRVLGVMLPWFTEKFGNAASTSHQYGWEAEEAVKISREQIASLIGADPKEIIFTSGATESDNLAIKGVFEMYGTRGNHIITVETEHKAVLDTCIQLEKRGARISYMKVNRDGFINSEELESAITDQTILIAVMYANNETGVVQPIREIGAIAKKHHIIFFTDATQAIGKLPVNVQQDGIDLMALSAHKLYGPKGVGVLYVRRKNPRVRLAAQINGGSHEMGMRSGTLNVPGIVGLGKACELSQDNLSVESNSIASLRNYLEESLLKLKGCFRNGPEINRLPQVTNLRFANCRASDLMIHMNKDIAVSSGSACSSASPEPSHVLIAMGLTEEEAHSSIRFSLGRFTTKEELDYAIHKIREEVDQERSIYI
ncbi:MAG TPA: IscS subfamily cysteine desulfurase [Puia sp.]|nr:IscS subfamily cysteine desulfurase [Puia sp.]